MCASYWTLRVKDMDCPKCHKKSDWELQTHFNGGGRGGMCDSYYELNELIIPLHGITMTMDRNQDWFIDSCPKCKVFLDFGADVIDGRVVRVFELPIPNEGEKA